MTSISPDELMLAYHHDADGFLPLPLDAWVIRLRAAGFIGLGQKYPPRRPITLWRGQALNRPLGMSWARGRYTAEHFARRHVNITAMVDHIQVRGGIWRAVAPPSAVLAIPSRDLGEPGEVLVDPAGLIGLTLWAIVGDQS